jgi:hypothetical protein
VVKVSEEAECFIKGWFARIRFETVEELVFDAFDRKKELSDAEKNIALTTLNIIEEEMSGCLDKNKAKLLSTIRRNIAENMVEEAYINILKFRDEVGGRH